VARNPDVITAYLGAEKINAAGPDRCREAGTCRGKVVLEKPRAACRRVALEDLSPSCTRRGRRVAGPQWRGRPSLRAITGTVKATAGSMT
jgi:hypothetical protein